MPAAYIFGAGHISKSLSKVATLAGFRTVVADDRDTYANQERFPEASEVYAAEYETIRGELEHLLKEKIGVKFGVEVHAPGDLDDWTEIKTSPKTKRFRDERG